MNETNELETLFPLPQILTVQDEEVDISPLRIGEVPRVLKALSGVAIPTDGGSVDVLALLSGEHGEAVLDAVAIACRRERAWLDRLPTDEALTLALRVLEVNADFFARRVLPLVTEGMNRVATTLGQTASSAL